MLTLSAIVTEGVGAGITVIVTALLVTVVGEAQLAFEVSNTVTTSLLFSEDVVKVDPPVPTLVPLTFH